MKNRQFHLLQAAFAAGAITDALALLPMLFPPLAKVMWGIADESGSYRFAMGYGAALMLGWTGLLMWAYQRPSERRFVALLTILVICGLVITEILSVLAGSVAFGRMIPTWILQAILLALLGIGYHYSISPLSTLEQS